MRSLLFYASILSLLPLVGCGASEMKMNYGFMMENGGRPVKAVIKFSKDRMEESFQLTNWVAFTNYNLTPATQTWRLAQQRSGEPKAGQIWCMSEQTSVKVPVVRSMGDHTWTNDWQIVSGYSELIQVISVSSNYVRCRVRINSYGSTASPESEAYLLPHWLTNNATLVTFK